MSNPINSNPDYNAQHLQMGGSDDQEAGGILSRFSRKKKQDDNSTNKSTDNANLSNSSNAAAPAAASASAPANNAATPANNAAASASANNVVSEVNATSVTNKWTKDNFVLIDSEKTTWRQFDSKPFEFVKILQNKKFNQASGFDVVVVKDFLENGFYLKLTNVKGDDYQASIFKCIQPKKGMFNAPKCVDEKGTTIKVPKPHKKLSYHVIPQWFADNFQLWQVTDPIDANVFQDVISKIANGETSQNSNSNSNSNSDNSNNADGNNIGNTISKSVDNAVNVADFAAKKGQEAFEKSLTSVSDIAKKSQQALGNAASGAFNIGKNLLSNSISSNARKPITEHMDNLKKVVENKSVPTLLTDVTKGIKYPMKFDDVIPTIPEELEDITNKTIPEVSKMSAYKIYDSTTNLLIAHILYSIDKLIDLVALYTLGYKNLSSVNKDEIVQNLEQKRILFLKLSNDPNARKIIQDLSLAVAEVLKTVINASAKPVGKAVDKIVEALSRGYDRISMRVMNSLKNTIRIVPGIGDAYIIIENILNIGKLTTDAGLAISKTANASSAGIAESIEEITPQIKGQLNFLKQTANEFEALRQKISKDTAGKIKSATMPKLPDVNLNMPVIENEAEKIKRGIKSTGDKISTNIDNARESFYGKKKGGARRKKPLRKNSSRKLMKKYKKRSRKSNTLKRRKTKN